MTQTRDSIHTILRHCKYNDWDFVLYFDDDRPYLQLQFDGPDSFTGIVERQFCRKWFLSYHMTDSEIVQTAYAAVKMAVLHEVAEDFRFFEEPVYHPHYDVYSLLKLSSQRKIDMRKT